MSRPLPDLMASDWADAMEPMASKISHLGNFLRAEIAEGRGYLPPGNAVLRAFQEPMKNVKVLVVGQDPYPTPGHAMGLSFSVARGVRPLPRSLINIYTELHHDLGITPAEHGDLTAWARQGVLMLNRVLTVRPGAPASHRGQGWEAVTEHAIRALASRDQPLVAILWGRDAQSVAPMLGSTPRIESAHPSPLSAARGFFGSAPFSRANSYLEAQGADPIDWSCTG